MGDPQDPLGAFYAAYQVFIWRSPTGMVDLVRGALRRSGLLDGADVPPDVIEGMMYGRRLSEVLTLCHTSANLQGLCVALQTQSIGY